METENKINSPEGEIEKLKQRIADLESGALNKPGHEEIKVDFVREVVKEHAREAPEQILEKEYILPEKEIEERAQQVADVEPGEQAHQAQITALIQLAHSKGILNAVSVANKLNDPHLEDDFHDALVKYLLATTDTPIDAGGDKKLKKSLGLILFEITLPQEQQRDGEEGKYAKELIAVMEQFYSGMSATGSYFVLEVGLPFSSSEVVFYVAVPKDKSRIFEKQIQGLYPSAKVVMKKADYNIFKPEGFALGAIAKLKKNPILPIKTYDKFETDPIRVILNTFSKLEKEGEGAALQIVVAPGGGIGSKARSVAMKMRSGKSFEDAGGKETGAMDWVFDMIDGVILGSAKSGKKENEQKPIDESVVKLLEEKFAKQAMAVNIRLLVSANESEDKARVILEELESAFLQFQEEGGNSFYFNKMSGSKLKKLFHNFSFRIQDKKTALPLNTAELATIFHFPSGISAASAPQLKYAKTKEEAPPMNLSSSGLLLGKNIYRGEEKNVYMNANDRRRHFYVIGQTGTGKSVLLKNMIIQDIEAGRGVCFIDPHGSDLQEVLARIPENRIDDVIYFNPSDTARPMGLNMLEYDTRFPEQKSFVVDELFSIFKKLYGSVPESMGPMFEQYFRNATMLVIEDPESGNTLLDVSRVMADEHFRELKLSKCKNPIVSQFWIDVAGKAGGEAALANMVPYITSKFDVFLANEIMRPIIGQEKSAFNFRQVMDDQKILLVNLSKGRLGDLNSSLLGLVIVGKLLMASLSRVDMPEDQRKDFYLYLDEFQNVSTDSIATILSEARKYRLNLTLAHQFIAQLDESINKAVFGNVGSMATFRIGVEDATFLEKQFEPTFTSTDLINIDNYNAYAKLLIDGQTSKPFNFQTMPFEKGDPARGDEIAKLSSLKYGKPREEVEEMIKRRYNY